MAEIIDYLEDFNNVSIVIRLVLATIFGGIIGMEREAKGHSAGFRTFTLVCLGATLATIVNLFLQKETGLADAARIPAQVISGIGFLGVGTIIVTRKNTVRGLTTAATLWATACLGLALGAGMLATSCLAFIFILFTVSVLQRLGRYIAGHNREIFLYIEVEKDKDIRELTEYISSKGYGLNTMEKKRENVSKNIDMTIMIELDLKKNTLHTDILNEFSKLDCVYYIEEVRN